VLLQWNATSQTEAYNVFRSTTSGGTGTKIGNVRTSASLPTFTDTAVTAGTIYYYQMQTTNAAGASAFSSAVSVVASDN
jgi:cellulose 1,4-beta-cellobiosidase